MLYHLNISTVMRNIATTSSQRRRWYRYHRLSTSKCHVSSSSSCVVNSPCTTPWMWDHDRPSPSQRPSALPRPRSYSHTPDVQLPSPACNWRLRQLRPAQPSKCYFTSQWPPSVREILSRRPNHIISNVLLNRYWYFIKDVFRTQICLIKHNKFDMRALFRIGHSTRWKGLRQSIIIFVTKSPFWREA